LLHLNVLYEQLNYLKIYFFINVPLLIGNRRRGRIKPKIGKEDKIGGGGGECLLALHYPSSCSFGFNSEGFRLQRLPIEHCTIKENILQTHLTDFIFSVFFNEVL